MVQRLLGYLLMQSSLSKKSASLLICVLGPWVEMSQVGINTRRYAEVVGAQRIRTMQQCGRRKIRKSRIGNELNTWTQVAKRLPGSASKAALSSSCCLSTGTLSLHSTFLVGLRESINKSIENKRTLELLEGRAPVEKGHVETWRQKGNPQVTLAMPQEWSQVAMQLFTPSVY